MNRRVLFAAANTILSTPTGKNWRNRQHDPNWAIRVARRKVLQEERL
jgi:hypothetical protein